MHNSIAIIALLFSSALVQANDVDFSRCIDTLRPQAFKAGISEAIFNTHAATVSADMTVIDAMNYQPEFKTPIWDYLAGLVDEERIADGRAMLETHRDLLAKISKQYGVDVPTIVAVWGVESNFGKTLGKKPLVQSLMTLSCIGRRQTYFRSELFSTLKIIERGDIDVAKLNGSWAGAFGQTQFMPSTFLRIAQDFDGDGKRDLIDNIPDALASTANYLKRSNWRTGEDWGLEVSLPKNFDASLAGRRNKRAISDWQARGITPLNAESFDDSTRQAGLLLPAGANGPAFLVFRNFDAIYSYNAAESYALAIAVLSDYLRSNGGIKTAWPTDDPGLSRAQRRQLQQLLVARGHDIGEIDGMIGEKSRAAIASEQQRLGWKVDSRAGKKILDALSKSSSQ